MEATEEGKGRFSRQAFEDGFLRKVWDLLWGVLGPAAVDSWSKDLVLELLLGGITTGREWIVGGLSDGRSRELPLE